MIKRHSMTLAAGLTMFLLAMHVGAVSHAADRLVVSSGHQGGWDALKQTPQALAEGVRDSLGEKAGHRAHHATSGATVE